MTHKLVFLYDGGCPLCLKETNFLRNKDFLNKIKFVDIDNENYNPNSFNGISYADAMSNLHGILEHGEIIRGLDVLAYAYELVDLGWVYFPLKVQILSPILKVIYSYWAKYRLRITGRSNIGKLCNSKCYK